MERHLETLIGLGPLRYLNGVSVVHRAAYEIEIRQSLIDDGRGQWMHGRVVVKGTVQAPNIDTYLKRQDRLVLTLPGGRQMRFQFKDATGAIYVQWLGERDV
jgi:hypothetical protein